MNPAIKERLSPVTAAGAEKGGWLSVLEQVANLLQDSTPLKDFDVYVVGFHCAKNEAHPQMEAHHYCRVVNDDLLQCVLFDGNTRQANLIGIEYIISGTLFDTLGEGEKPYWHPHNFEVLSGQLVAPGLPAAAETALMKQLINSYGKTWHTWHTGRPGQPGQTLPLGEPKLMWSFNREGECDEALETDRNQAMGFDTDKTRTQRQSLLELAQPQCGVDTMKGQFNGSTPIRGVVDVDAD